MKHLRERENKVSNENKELYELNEAMKAELLFMTDVIKESTGIERENHALKKRVIELEEKQKKKESNVEQLKKATGMKREEIRKWKEKYKQSKYRRPLSNWLGDNNTTKEK